jgi:hypothetical protein
MGAASAFGSRRLLPGSPREIPRILVISSLHGLVPALTSPSTPFSLPPSLSNAVKATPVAAWFAGPAQTADVAGVAEQGDGALEAPGLEAGGYGIDSAVTLVQRHADARQRPETWTLLGDD